MLSTISSEGYKCFREQKEIDFGRLTLLTGYNAAGKSAAIEPLITLKQAHDGGYMDYNANAAVVSNLLGTAINTIPVDGPAHKLSNQSSDGLSFDFSYGAKGEEKQTCYMFDEPGKEDNFLILNEKKGYRVINDGLTNILDPDVANNCTLWQTNICHLDVGRTDRKLEEEEEEKIWNKKPALGYPKEIVDGDMLVGAVSYWHSVLKVGYYFGHPKCLGFRFANPILVEGLACSPGDILIVDKPELGLHPRAQSLLGLFFCNLAAVGIQVIIETHSDHILNGVRLAVCNRDLSISPEDVLINFFDYSERYLGEPLVHQLQIDKDGRIDRWPKGFFDQIENDLNGLRGPSDSCPDGEAK